MMRRLLEWAPLAGVLIAAGAYFTPYPAEIGAGGALLTLGAVLYRRIQRRRLLEYLERRAGAPRRKRRAAHRAGGRAVWRATRGRFG